MYKLPPTERGRNILHERHKRETYDIHRKKVHARCVSFFPFAPPPPAPSTAAASSSTAKKCVRVACPFPPSPRLRPHPQQPLHISPKLCRPPPGPVASGGSTCSKTRGPDRGA